MTSDVRDTLRWQTSPLVPNCLITVNKPELGGSIVTGLGQLNYVASCRSSTTESASDVSPSHHFHLASGTCHIFGLFCVLCLVVFVFVGLNLTIQTTMPEKSSSMQREGFS